MSMRYRDKRNRQAPQRTWSEWEDGKLEELAAWICDAQVVVWFTGAGISTESGLPDFRGPNGLRTRARKGLPRPKLGKPFDELQPNAAHLAIVEFEALGKCDFLVSQNVDNLHLKSGFPFEKLAELHGNKKRLRCRPCGKTFPKEQFKDAHKRPEKPVPVNCPNCGRRMQKSVINFGDSLPEANLAASFDWARKADVMVVVGSTCQVYPATDVARATKDCGGRLVIVNIGKTGLDNVCDLRFHDEKAGVLLPKLLAKVQRQLKGTGR